MPDDGMASSRMGNPSGEAPIQSRAACSLPGSFSGAANWGFAEASRAFNKIRPASYKCRRLSLERTQENEARLSKHHGPSNLSHAFTAHQWQTPQGSGQAA